MPQSASDTLEELVVSGITTDRQIAKLTLTGLRQDSAVISEIFQSLGNLGINVDIIVHDKPLGEQSLRLGFTIATSDLEAARKAIAELAADKGYSGLAVAAEGGLAKISAVGVGMRSYAGVAGRTFTALTSQGIVIHMISTSEIKISVVVDEAEATRATQALHREFVGE